MRRSAPWQIFSVVSAVLQFALPGAALVADARLERESMASPSAHVESSSTKACRPIHPDQCALCQFLSRTAPPSETAALPAIAAAVRPAATSPIPRHATRDLADVGFPPAPPTLAGSGRTTPAAARAFVARRWPGRIPHGPFASRSCLGPERCVTRAQPCTTLPCAYSD
jgi:hypothetical protein